MSMPDALRARVHRGVTVVELEMKQINDLFEALGEIEAVCAGLSAQRMTVVERKNLEVLHMKEARMLAEEDSVYFDHNEQVHSAIHAGSQMRHWPKSLRILDAG